MNGLDLRVLQDAVSWKTLGHQVYLLTVVQTWGSAPRVPGALLAIREDGCISGSVSGGCVEEDLIARVKQGALGPSTLHAALPCLLVYGVTQEEANRWGLPCGGTLKLMCEQVADTDWLQAVLRRTQAHELVRRTLVMADGQTHLAPAQRGDVFAFDGVQMQQIFGPNWRLLIIGAGQLGQALAAMAQMLDFEVLLCDPREEYQASFSVPDVVYMPGMPDDVVSQIQVDAHTAVVALTHDPKLDDMALLEALQSPAFYVGALGSQRSQARRAERLQNHFGISDAQLARLHAPVGLDLGGKAPAEIALAIMAHIVQIKYQITKLE